MEEEVKRILKSDKTTYQIAKETGVSTAIIDNYRTGKSKIENMTMTILQKLICARTNK
ncbi:XRE family transcriptional regulator [Solobacterium moorei]|uniref:XRE family transcriptional regulator n=1 Tax=Solobacterium moorei TaxID=102148 RepID=UPI0023F4BDEE|nr:XRE family transcriptional regulator [Solobacterium moorei]